jgi:hypothetical protein
MTMKQEGGMVLSFKKSLSSLSDDPVDVDEDEDEDVVEDHNHHNQQQQQDKDEELKIQDSQEEGSSQSAFHQRDHDARIQLLCRLAPIQEIQRLEAAAAPVVRTSRSLRPLLKARQMIVMTTAHHWCRCRLQRIKARGKRRNRKRTTAACLTDKQQSTITIGRRAWTDQTFR